MQSGRKRGLSSLPNEGLSRVDVSVSGITGRSIYSGCFPFDFLLCEPGASLACL